MPHSWGELILNVSNSKVGGWRRGAVFSLPLDKDNDKIADKWEREKIAEWNAQYHLQGKEGFIAEKDIKAMRPDLQERPDPDNQTDGGANSYGGRNLPAHNTTFVHEGVTHTRGDNKTLFQEYRGYVLDGGGYDWNGENAVKNRHVRLSPAFKELLVEVDRMSPEKAAVPYYQFLEDTSEKTWMDAVAKAMSDKTTGLGVRMYYVIDDLNTRHKKFEGPNADDESLTYGSSYSQNRPNLDPTKDPVLPGFTHLHFLDTMLRPGTGQPGSPNTAVVALRRSKESADSWEINENQYIISLISHELAHTYVSPDGPLHIVDGNDNGTEGDAEDKTLVLWDYDWMEDHPQTKRVKLGANQTITVNAAALPLNDVTNLTPTGLVKIGNNIVKYASVNQNNSTLTDLIWRFSDPNDLVAREYQNDELVTLLEDLSDHRQARPKYGEALIRRVRWL